MLGATRGAVLVREPDNEKLSPPAIEAKRKLGRFPVLEASDEAPEYENLWRWAFGGAQTSSRQRIAERMIAKASADELEEMIRGHRSKRLQATALTGSLPSRVPESCEAGAVIAKSVHACMAIEWIAARFEVEVLVLLRHPANVLASSLELDLPDRDRDLYSVKQIREHYVEPWGIPAPGNSLTEMVAWQVGLMTSALEEAASRHPQWQVRTHEELCVDPAASFPTLAESLGLEWEGRSAAALEESQRPGTGFEEQREAQTLIEGWKKRLNGDQVSAMLRVLEPFPLRTWSPRQLAEGGEGSTAWSRG
jgi:hypothetical protein